MKIAAQILLAGALTLGVAQPVFASEERSSEESNFVYDIIPGVGPISPGLTLKEVSSTKRSPAALRALLQEKANQRCDERIPNAKASSFEVGDVDRQDIYLDDYLTYAKRPSKNPTAFLEKFYSEHLSIYGAPKSKVLAFTKLACSAAKSRIESFIARMAVDRSMFDRSIIYRSDRAKDANFWAGEFENIGL